MNTQVKFILTGIIAFAAGGLLVFYLAGHPSKSGGDEGDKGAAAGPVQLKHGPNGETILTLDAETQERIGLKTSSPVPCQWPAQIHAVGRVVDPLVFMAAAADYESARAAALASQSELERNRKLAEQSNVSPRMLEAAQAAAARDTLALNSARAKFTADWGVHQAAQTNLVTFAEKLQTDGLALVKLWLPAGAFPNPLPSAATIFIFDNATNSVAADFAADLGIDPQTQAQTLMFLAQRKLAPGISVTAQLKLPGEPGSGMVVPFDAVLRYEGKGWIYIQTGTNDFTRVEIPLDHPAENGWFLSGSLAVTNPIVVVGAQTVLSAELSGGNFNTGERD